MERAELPTTLHPLAAEWRDTVLEVHPRPTSAVTAAATQWADAFSARIAGGMQLPIRMVFEAEESLGVRPQMSRHPGTVRAKLVYHRAVPADYWRKHEPAR